MIIAEEKRKENIVEYIIYIRQIQDIIRSTGFDITILEKVIINQYDISEKLKVKIRDWYSDLIISMKQEGLEKSGDFKFIQDLIDDLNIIHLNLLEDSTDYKHKELFRWAKPNIDEFRTLSRMQNQNDINVCIDALHSLLLLRIKKEKISDETMQAMQTFSNLLANLALKYREPAN